MIKRTFRVSFRPEDIACTPPCGMDAALQSMDEMIMSVLNRYADDAHDEKLRFGHSNVEIKNGLVAIYQDSEEETEKVVSILKQYFRVRDFI